MKKSTFLYSLIAAVCICVHPAYADDASIDLSAEIAAAESASTSPAVPAQTNVNAAPSTPTPTAATPSTTIARAGVLRPMAPVPVGVNPAPVVQPTDVTTPSTTDTSGTTMARAAVPSRVAIQTITNARAATGDEAAQQAVLQAAQSTVASRVAIPRAAGDNSGTVQRSASDASAAAPRIITSAPGVSRAAASQAAQNNNQTTERAEFHANEKGIANESSAVRRAGVSLRPSVAEVGGRATIPGTNVMTGSNIGNETSGRAAVVARASTTLASGQTSASIPVANRPSTTGMTADATSINAGVSVEDVTNKLSAINDLSASCVQQYADCMDQFCNVLDKNQARCSCSDRISTYSKTEQAVKDANTQLNTVAQNIRYVGLSADEIHAIMNSTEAEQAMQGQVDTTANRQLLDQIANMVTIPSTSGTDTGGTTAIDLTGINIDFLNNPDATDMFNLDALLGGDSTFSNLRGAGLYSAAKGKCANVLNTCVKAGASSSLITGQYDMMIDKDCNTYVAGLDKMNQTLKTNVRSATLMLQQARLQNLQNNNQYDEKACVGALNTCMTDDMVCGANYERCMDPTKRYIDASGNVILGQDIAQITNLMTGVDKASSFNAASFDSAMIGGLSPSTQCQNADGSGKCIAAYLLYKIGTKEDVTSGLCRPVLSKCRRYTYDANGKFMFPNDVIVNYIQNAMVQINANQMKTISNYAQNCLQDVSTCYNGQVSQLNQYTSAMSASSVINVMRGACRNVALTCAYAIWAAPEKGGATAASCRYCSDGGDACTAAQSLTDTDKCIESLSNMFYQTMLCPLNSTYITISNTNGASAGPGIFAFQPQGSSTWLLNTPGNTAPTAGAAYSVMVNDKCVCLPGYGYAAGACVQKPDNSEWKLDCTPTAVGNLNSSTTTSGGCAIVGYSCLSGYKPSNGVCVAVTPCPTGSTAAAACTAQTPGSTTTQACVSANCLCNNVGVLVNSACP